MTSELSKHLNEQLGVVLNVKQQKMKLAKNIEKKIFKLKLFLHNVKFYEILLLFKFLKIFYVLL